MLESIKGDKVLWGILALLAIFSFLPIFSSSTNLVYVVGKGTPWGYFFKHFIILSIGFFLMYSIHKVPFKYFKGISILMLPIVILLLIYTLSQGTIISGANASRWLKIPIVGISFQTSTLASIVLMVYSARYLSKLKIKKSNLKNSLLEFWLPVFVIVLLILPSNLSTAILLFSMILMLAFIASYPLKFLISIIILGLTSLFVFISLARSFPEIFPNRIDTWINRIENFKTGQSADGNYQLSRAKTAIVSGKFIGLGAGKSRMKNFLPQSSSDFIYPIIVEEFGLIGGVALILLYLLLLYRIVVISYRTKSSFGKLTVIGLGIPIVSQAFVNIGVALQVIPVTGQNLPMISSGGTSAWITCIAMGIILSVSTKIESDDDLKIENNNPLNILSEID
ncbi:MAG: cell division protein FtsW [Flavobacteriaceae bacterium TMED68]|nr:MAG: cell division protein FtsW [Flavobacteriaceae bacterium TMED68]|tara:strand:+ start:2494 stop:3678 length:1185 start_codon:yes stop_codon:yes gene_type:complete